MIITGFSLYVILTFILLCVVYGEIGLDSKLPMLIVNVVAHN